MRDVSRILSDADLIKLRELLKAAPAGGPVSAEYEFQDYPRMLFYPGWVECQRIIKAETGNPDGMQQALLLKQAQETIKRLQVIVHDVETEEEYLADGWKRDPNDLVIELNIAAGMAQPDPRVPTGREGRRAAHLKKLDADQELANIRRRYAEPTGRRIADDDAGAAPAPMTTAEEVVAPPFADADPAPSAKQQRVRAAARRSSGVSASA